MAELVGNCLIGQTGGPTAVINASVAGVVAEALNHESIEEVYGALNGVLGLLNEEFVDSPPSRSRPSAASASRPAPPSAPAAAS